MITVGCGAKSTCVPGQSAACVCSDGTGGAQVCKGDGTFGVCQCGSSVGTGGNGGGGGAGGGGGTGGGGDMATGSTGAKRVFVTSTAYAATVAQTVCQSVADSKSLGGTWVAWLSNQYAAAIDADGRIAGDGPWKLLDGTIVFANHGQLATAPSAPIDVFEDGQKAPGPLTVWTGTLTGGVHSGHDCSGWGSNSSTYTGDVGTTTTSGWTDANTVACNNIARVYCFEQ